MLWIFNNSWEIPENWQSISTELTVKEGKQCDLDMLMAS